MRDKPIDNNDTTCDRGLWDCYSKEMQKWAEEATFDPDPYDEFSDEEFTCLSDQCIDTHTFEDRLGQHDCSS